MRESRWQFPACLVINLRIRDTDVDAVVYFLQTRLDVRKKKGLDVGV